MIHLHLDRLREHLVKRPRRGRVDQHTAVARLGRETVFDFEAVVLVFRIGDQMAVRSAETHERAVAHNERRFGVGVLVQMRYVDVPATQILTVEQACRFSQRRILSGQGVYARRLCGGRRLEHGEAGNKGNR